MTSLALLGLIPQPGGRIRSGQVLLNGEDLTQVSAQRLRGIRGASIGMIFQEPMTALNPVQTIGAQIGEALRLHTALASAAIRERCIELLKEVGIASPANRIDEYPHQLSGGMRQRVMIAMALACEPELLIADEPTTALDVTVQAQIFDLLTDLQARKGTAILLITHDMGVIAELCDRVAVMYAGRIVEQGTTAEVLTQPLHPYTRGLIACLPESRTDNSQLLAEIPGIVPAMHTLGEACAFKERCQDAHAECQHSPQLRPYQESKRLVACHAIRRDRPPATTMSQTP
jgi:peptide/nickel transport system ATP-binding protein